MKRRQFLFSAGIAAGVALALPIRAIQPPASDADRLQTFFDGEGSRVFEGQHLRLDKPVIFAGHYAATIRDCTIEMVTDDATLRLTGAGEHALVIKDSTLLKSPSRHQGQPIIVDEWLWDVDKMRGVHLSTEHGVRWFDEGGLIK